jgi:hypothetical protein
MKILKIIKKPKYLKSKKHILLKIYIEKQLKYKLFEKICLKRGEINDWFGLC